MNADDIDVRPGRYVVAVSGGVDSMALLHLLWQKSQRRDEGWHLTVAHFDHGIRPDSAEDRQLVKDTAESYDLPFVYDEGHLGPEASEDSARRARYAFLRRVRQASGAQAIITAHHQDDLLETAIHNLLRGTGRKGLTALSNGPDIIRPLLAYPKQAMIDYANEHQLQWREDSTNQDETYARNYIRHQLMPRFNPESRQRLLEIIYRLQDVNRELDLVLINQLHLQSTAGTIDRRWFNQLPHNVAREVMATWLRAHGQRTFDRKLLERLAVQAKVAAPGTSYPLPRDHYLRISHNNLALDMAER